MKKTSKKITKNQTAKVSLFEKRLPRNHGEWLSICINLTLRAANPQSANDAMTAQYQRLYNALEAWKRDNPKETVREYVGINPK